MTEGAKETAWATWAMPTADLGEMRKAIEYYEQALAISREIGDRRGEGDDLGNLGTSLSQSGRDRKAIEYYEQALAISQIEIGGGRMRQELAAMWARIEGISTISVSLQRSSSRAGGHRPRDGADPSSRAGLQDRSRTLGENLIVAPCCTDRLRQLDTMSSRLRSSARSRIERMRAMLYATWAKPMPTLAKSAKPSTTMSNR